MDRVYMDLETTGLDPYQDRIVEIALLRETVYENMGPTVIVPARSVVRRVNPGVPISKSATAVHGITDADVADQPRFSEIVEAVEDAIADAVLVTFSGRRFDVPMLDAELRRCGRPGLPRDEEGFISQPEIDVRRLWMIGEPRTLEGAVRRFADAAIVDAHSAGGDASVLSDVLAGMLDDHGMALLEDGTDLDWDSETEALVRLCVSDDEVDRDGKFRRREDDGVIVFGFGKHRDQPVARHMDYVDWMLGQDFPPETVAWCQKFKRLASEAADERRNER